MKSDFDLALEQLINWRTNVEFFLSPTQKKHVDEKIHKINQLKSNYEELVKDIGNKPLKVPIIGSFSAGKSSFINHVFELKEHQKCPVKLASSTAFITRFAYADKDQIYKSDFGKENKKPINYDQYKLLVQQQSNDAEESHFEFLQELPNEYFKAIEIIDTPGFNSQNQKHSEITEAVIKDAHYLIYIWSMTKGQFGNDDDEIIKKITAINKDIKIFFIASWADKKSPSARTKILETLEKERGDYFEEIIAFSCENEQLEDDVFTKIKLREKLNKIKERRQELKSSLISYQKEKCRAELKAEINSLDELRDFLLIDERAYVNKNADENSHVNIVKELLKNLEKEYKNVLKDFSNYLDKRLFKVKEIKDSGWFTNYAEVKINIDKAKEFFSQKIGEDPEIHRDLKSLKHDFKRAYWESIFRNQHLLKIKAETLFEDLKKNIESKGPHSLKKLATKFKKFEKSHRSYVSYLDKKSKAWDTESCAEDAIKEFKEKELKELTQEIISESLLQIKSQCAVILFCFELAAENFFSCEKNRLNEAIKLLEKGISNEEYK